MPSSPAGLDHSLDAIPVLRPDSALTGEARVPTDTSPASEGVIQRAIINSTTNRPYRDLSALRRSEWYASLEEIDRPLAEQVHNNTKSLTGTRDVSERDALLWIRTLSPRVVLETIDNRGRDRSPVREKGRSFGSDEEPDRDLKKKLTKKRKRKSSSSRESERKGSNIERPIIIDSSDEEKDPLLHVDTRANDKEKYNNFYFDDSIWYRGDDGRSKEKKSALSEEDEEDPLLFGGTNVNDEEQLDDFKGTISEDEEDPLLDKDDSSEKSESSEGGSPQPKKRKGNSGKQIKPARKKFRKRLHEKSRVRGSGKSSESNLKLGRFARKTLARGVGGKKTKKRTRAYSVAFVTFHIQTSKGEVELPLKEKGKIASFVNLKSIRTLHDTKREKIERRTSILGVTDTGNGAKEWKSKLGLTGAIANTNAHAEVAISEYLLQKKDRVIAEIRGKLEEGETLQSVTLRVDIDKPPCTGCTNKLSIAHKDLSSELGVPVHFSVVYPEKKSNEGIRGKYSKVREDGSTDDESASDREINEESSIPVTYSRDEEVSDDSSDEEKKPLVKKKKTVKKSKSKEK